MDRHSGEKQGFLLTSNRLETSRHVLDTLRNVGGEQGPIFLKGCADKALVILGELRSCSVESSVEDLVDLVLDGQTVIARDMKEDAQRLAEVLDSIHYLVSKKVADKNLRHHNPWKRAKDERKINDFRDRLKLFVGKFGGTTTLSIHHSVEKLMAESLKEQDKEKRDEARKTKESVNNIQSVGSLSSNLQNLHIRNDDPQNTRPAIISLTSNLEKMHIRNDAPHNSIYGPIGVVMPTPAVPATSRPIPAMDVGASPVAKRKREEERNTEQEGRKVTEECYQHWEFPSPAVSHSRDQPNSPSPFATGNRGSGTDVDNEAFARMLQERYRREDEEMMRQEQQDRQAAMREAALEQIRAEEEMKKNKRPCHNFPTSIPPARAYTFDNVNGSGISIGGGPVYVNNGPGNITNTSYNDSFNDHSTRHYTYHTK